MLILDKLEKGNHVGPAKVIDCFQAREHGPVGQALEVILTDVLQTMVAELIFINSFGNFCYKLTSMVVRRSNL